MVSIALLDDFIEGSRTSSVFSTRELTSDNPLRQFLCKELNDAFLCKPIAVVQVSNPALEHAYANSLHAFNNHGVNPNERFLYHASKAPLQSICETGLTPQTDKRGLFGGPAIYLAETLNKANRYVSSFGDVTQVRALLRCRVLLGNVKEYPLGHNEHARQRAPEGFQSIQGFVANGVEYVVYSPRQVLITEVIFYRVPYLYVDASRVFVPRFFTGTVACIDPYLSFLFSNLVNNKSIDRSTVYRLIYQLIARTISLSEFLIVFSHALDHVYPNPNIVKNIENALAKSTLVVHYNEGVPCVPFERAGLMAFQLF